MRFFQGLDVSASALSAQRLRLDLISSNIANVNTTRTPEGGPYRRKVPVFAEHMKGALGKVALKGVKVISITQDDAPFRRVYEPSHPDADREGYVYYPNVNIVNEMVNLMEAGRVYEANVTAFNSGKEIFKAALNIGRA